jgi:large subunit ribosomal protein L30
MSEKTEISKARSAKRSNKAKSHIKVTKIKSTIGFPGSVTRTLEGMGLRKMGSTNLLPDNNCTRGMINKVKHFVSYELGS